MEKVSKTVKERLYGVDFIRVICALGIICFHYSSHNISQFKVFYLQPYGGWGDIFVAVFFAISGGMLYYNYEKIDSLKQFYFKRWKSIFPAFYIAFFFVWLDKVYQTGNLFYGGDIRKILLSILGLDGYFAYRGANYYLIGEWFLGAIIILYLIYPLLLFIIKRFEFPFLILLSVLLVWETNSSLFIISPWCNMISCIFSFYVGMVCFKHLGLMKNKWVILTSIVLTVVLYCKPFPINGVIAEHILAVPLMILLYDVGSYIMRYGIVNKVICRLSAVSYEMFLLQHVIILKVLGFRNLSSIRGFTGYLLVSILLIVIYSEVLHLVVKDCIKPKKDL